MAATIKIPTVFVAKDKFSSVISKMTAGVSKFAKGGIAAIDRLDHKINKTFNGMSKISKLAVGLGLGALLSSGFSDIKDFETGMVGVSKTTGIVDNDLKNLGQEFINSSKNLKVVSAEKLTELGQAAGQLGVKGADNIKKFAETLAKLEIASDIQGEEGAASIARLLTLTGEGVGVVDRFSAAIVALGNDSAASEKEILGVASEVARATNAYKLNSAEILGISTTLKSLDVAPEAAGTAVGKVFRGIEMATIKGGKTLRNYGKIMGMTSSQVRDTFKENPKDAFQFFIKGLNKIDKSGGSVAKALMDAGLSGETISKAIIPLASKYGLLTEKLKLATEEFEKNEALNKEFAAASKTVTTALKSIAVGFTNTLLASTNSGDGLQMVQDVLFYVAANMDTVVTAGAILIGTFAAMKVILWATKAGMLGYNIALGIQGGLSNKASIAIGKNTVALGAYKVAQAASTAWTWIATTATTAFGIALNLGLWPILAIIAAIVAVILVIKNWSTITAWFGEKWKQFTSWISDLWGNVVTWFQEFDFVDFFKSIGQSIIKFMLLPMTGLLTLLSKIPGKIGEMATLGLQNINKITGQIDVNDDRKPLPSPESRSSEIIQKSTSRNQLDVNLNDPGGAVNNVSSSGDNDIPINITNTQGAFG